MSDSLRCGDVLIHRQTGAKVRIIHIVGETIGIAPAIMKSPDEPLTYTTATQVDDEFERTNEAA